MFCKHRKHNGQNLQNNYEIFICVLFHVCLYRENNFLAKSVYANFPSVVYTSLENIL